MAKIICPECDSEISQYADMCPTCGFPIKSFMEKMVDYLKKALIYGHTRRISS